MANERVSQKKVINKPPKKTSGPVTPATGESDGQWPRAKYRAHAVDLKHPHGYEVRRVNSEEEAARLGEGWVDSPADLQ